MHMDIFACFHVCICVLCERTCMYACMHVCMHAYMCVSVAAEMEKEVQVIFGQGIYNESHVKISKLSL